MNLQNVLELLDDNGITFNNGIVKEINDKVVDAKLPILEALNGKLEFDDVRQCYYKDLTFTQELDTNNIDFAMLNPMSRYDDSYYTLANILRESVINGGTIEAFRKIQLKELGYKSFNKVTKLIQAIIDATDDTYLKSMRNIEFAKICDGLKGTTITSRLYFSTLFYDYLSMSIGNSWRSCHNLCDGDYNTGCLSYALDSSTVICFIENTEHKKITRFCLNFNTNYDSCFWSTIYGSFKCSDAYTNAINEMLTELTGKPLVLHNPDYYSSFSKPNYRIETGSKYHYEDYLYNDNRAFASEGDVFEIGAEPICVECGGSFKGREGDDTSLHCNCGADNQCDRCGDYTSDELTEVTNSNGCTEYVCPDCLENNYHQCQDCGEWHTTSSMNDVGGSYNYKWICNDCLDNYMYCDECGIYHNSDDVMYSEHSDRWICNECGTTCNECGDVTLFEELTDGVCEHCLPDDDDDDDDDDDYDYDYDADCGEHDILDKEDRDSRDDYIASIL